MVKPLWLAVVMTALAVPALAQKSDPAPQKPAVAAKPKPAESRKPATKPPATLQAMPTPKPKPAARQAAPAPAPVTVPEPWVVRGVYQGDVPTDPGMRSWQPSPRGQR